MVSKSYKIDDVPGNPTTTRCWGGRGKEQALDGGKENQRLTNRCLMGCCEDLMCIFLNEEPKKIQNNTKPTKMEIGRFGVSLFSDGCYIYIYIFFLSTHTKSTLLFLIFFLSFLIDFFI